MLLAKKRCPHEVGEVITRYDDTDPNDIWRGTSWERIEGKFLFGADSNHALGSTGGEEVHTLSVDEMPSHNHGARTIWSAGRLERGDSFTRATYEWNDGSKYVEDTSAIMHSGGGLLTTTCPHTSAWQSGGGRHESADLKAVVA